MVDHALSWLRVAACGSASVPIAILASVFRFGSSSDRDIGLGLYALAAAWTIGSFVAVFFTPHRSVLRRILVLASILAVLVIGSLAALAIEPAARP